MDEKNFRKLKNTVFIYLFIIFFFYYVTILNYKTIIISEIINDIIDELVINTFLFAIDNNNIGHSIDLYLKFYLIMILAFIIIIILTFAFVSIFISILHNLNSHVINFRYKYEGIGTLYIVFIQISYIFLILMLIQLLNFGFNELFNLNIYNSSIINNDYFTLSNVCKMYAIQIILFFVVVYISKMKMYINLNSGNYKNDIRGIIYIISYWIIFIFSINIMRLLIPDYKYILDQEIIILLFVHFFIFIESFLVFLYLSFVTLLILVRDRGVIEEEIMDYSIFSLHITYNKIENIKDLYKEYNFYIPKNQNFNYNNDYLMLVLHKDYQLISKYVKSISDIYKTDGKDILLLDSSDAQNYNKIILKVCNKKYGKIFDCEISISDKQVFGIDEVYKYRKYFEKSRNNNSNDNTNEDIFNIQIATLKHLVIFEKDKRVHSRVDINYLTANYGAGKSTITNIYKNNGQNIFKFSLLSSDFKSSFFEKLYFSLKYENKNYLTRSTFIFFGAIFLAFIFSLLNNIIDIFALEYGYPGYLSIFKDWILIDSILGEFPLLFIFNISIIILGIILAFYIKDYVFSLNISNNYIKEDTYVKKILKYIEQNNILLVIEDHDRIFDGESVKLINTSFTKLYETKRKTSRKSSIIVTGMDLDEYTELVEENNDHYYIANDFYGKIFNIINKDGINSNETNVYLDYLVDIIKKYNSKYSLKPTYENIILKDRHNMRELKNTTDKILEVARDSNKMITLEEQIKLMNVTIKKKII